MGTSWKEIQAGVLDTGKVIAETMALWNQATRKAPSTAQTTVPQTSAPAVQTQPLAPAATPSTAAIPTWALLALGGAAAWLLLRKRG